MKRRPSTINALFAVNKPLGMTSHDVVAACRRFLGEKRIGHAGTLDPDASGVLVLGVGQATKLLGRLTLDTKRYVVAIELGSQTTTDDAAGDVIATAPVDQRYTEYDVAKAQVEALIGSFDQVPPQFSAIQQGGTRAYDLARAGKHVELEARPVTIYSAELLAVEAAGDKVCWICAFEVSKGCYIRSIARDLGLALGCYAHVSKLQRTASGAITLTQALSLEELEAGGTAALEHATINPLLALSWPLVRQVSLRELEAAAQGKRLALAPLDPKTPEGTAVALVADERLYGLWKVEAGQLVSDLNLVRGVDGVREVAVTSGCEVANAPVAAPAGERAEGALQAAGHHVQEVPDTPAIDPEARMAQIARRALALPSRVLPGVQEMAGATLYRAQGGAPLSDPVVLVMGAFDGVHRGHADLIERAKLDALERGLPLVVATFDPDPSFVVGTPQKMLTTHEAKVSQLMALGADAVISYDFTPKLAALSYERFVTQELLGRFELSALHVGTNFRLGAQGAGTAARLREFLSSYQVDVVVHELLQEGAAPVSATRIRALIQAGNMDEAAHLLGRAHAVTGVVVPGRKCGRTLGFPTANVVVDHAFAAPLSGVFEGIAVVGDMAWPAAINAGMPPTFLETAPGQPTNTLLEATLLGYEGDLYNQTVSLVITHKLRESKTFDSTDELIATVQGNMQDVVSHFGSLGVKLLGE